MIKLLTLFTLFISAVLMFTAPWLSALVYSIVSILQPHYVWFWAFEGYSVFKISAGVTILAWMFHAAQGNIDWRIYKTGQFIGVIVIAVIFHLSSLLSPFDNYFSLIGGDLVVDIYTTIAIMYFFVLGIINKPDTIKYFAFIYIGVTLYYTYWANDHYLSGNWYQFTHGRLRGIDRGPYTDGNVLSILIMTGISFVMFGIRYFKSNVIKLGFLAALPLILHALILLASRGALLSAACVVFFFAMVVKSKKLNIIITIGFVAMLAYQGGTMMSRTTETVSAAQGSEELENKPLNPRLASWQVGWGLALKYPLLGAGPQRFQYASQLHYPNKSKHVAHNTFLNFSANTGLIAGITYLLFFYFSFKQYKYVKSKVEFDSIHNYINMSSMGGLIGFFVGAIFLDLVIFEPFYFLLVLISSNYWMVKKEYEPSLATQKLPVVRATHAV